jgi:signal transduction histidine kinase
LLDQSNSDRKASIVVQQIDVNRENQRDILKYIIDIGSSLRLPMDTDTLLKRVAEATCRALGFRVSVLYLADDAGQFCAVAMSGTTVEDDEYLQQHPIPKDIVELLIDERYRISASYFLPAEAPLWKNEYLNSFFVILENAVEPTLLHVQKNIPLGDIWHPEDMLVVPLMSGENTLLGFLTPDMPLNDLRPTTETLSYLELLANQAAVVIEGAHLYEEAKRVSEERAALVEIGRALSAPEAQRDLQTVYRTIYEQVCRVMPADAFFITRYYPATDKLFIDFLIDEGVHYPSQEYSIFPETTRKLLFEEEVGYIFSTSSEYDKFTQNDLPQRQNLVGNQRHSESLIFAPIRHGEEVLGLLSAQSYRQYAYTKGHLELLKEIGVQAGIAITNARLNIELRDALKQAQESERLKNHFLMTASHELRTPLTAVQGYLELLGTFNDAIDEESKNRFINNARRACEELVLLLGNVMDTSRVDQDRVSMNLSPVQIVNAVQLILEILEPNIVREKRSVEVNIPDDLIVVVDELRLRQILLNLIGNALKYTPMSSNLAIKAERIEKDALNRRLTYVSQPLFEGKAQALALIAIRDWGPGIQAEDLPRLFTKFMRLDNAINSIQRGAGLGLYLCRQLTEAMGGRIWVESTGIAGDGTTFFVALPLS